MIRVMPDAPVPAVEGDVGGGNRRSGVNVGLPAHSRRGAEGCRRSQFDPTRTFKGVRVDERRRQTRMLGPQRLFADRQRAPVERRGLGVVALGFVKLRPKGRSYS